MSMNEKFFNKDDKVYAENLNDGILLSDAFQFVVTCELPAMFLDGAYPNDLLPHKAGVSVVQIIANEGLTIADDHITNNTSGEKVLRLRVYPNFNQFGGWKTLNWTGEGVTIDIVSKDTTSSLLPTGEWFNQFQSAHGGALNSGVLNGLKEYDLLITIPPNKALTTVSWEFKDQPDKRSVAKINPTNIKDTPGTVADANPGLVTGGAVYTELQPKEDKINKTNDYNNTSTTNYPSSKALADGLTQNTTNVLNTLRGEMSEGLSVKADANDVYTKTDIDDKLATKQNTLQSWKNVSLKSVDRFSNVNFSVQEDLRIANLIMQIEINNQTAGNVYDFVTYWIPEGYRPTGTLAQGYYNEYGGLQITNSGTVRWHAWKDRRDSKMGIYINMMWRY